ncbi:IS30 family transposase [Streptomyces sp. NPDC127066]|uniref:IS30 family transposase n=1 Tax=Streptomyces sp. NPDC127066 TaxID=3347125 RepID=UPI003654A1C3
MEVHVRDYGFSAVHQDEIWRQFPGDVVTQVSHEAIYLALYDPRHRAAIDRTLTQRLRTGRPVRRPKGARTASERGIIRDMVPISARPPARPPGRDRGPGDRRPLGGDLVMGTRPSVIGTMVERTSCHTALVALPDGIKAQQVRPHLTRSVLGVPTQLRRSLTWDRGREVAEHRDFTSATGGPVYFCKPLSPWQRGTNENTNRLLRQYLPKGADLRKLSRADLDCIAEELNHRPRKILGYRSPAEVYAGLLNSGDALTA